MYYHFYIKYYDLNNKLQEAYVENETNLENIKKKYIVPFKECKPTLIVSGSIIRLEKLESFRVLESEKSLDQIYNEACNSIPRGIIMIIRKVDLLSQHNI